MIYYIILGVCSVLMVLRRIFQKQAVSSFFTFIAFIILWVISSLRFEIGTDFTNYVNQYNEIKKLSFFQTNLEPLYILIVKVVYYTTDNPQYLFTIISFITLLAFFMFFDKKMGFVAVFAFITTMYLPSFSLIRQSAAVSILLLSSKAILEKKTIKSYLLTAVAAMFHFSALLFIVFILLRKYELKLKLGIFLLMFFYFMVGWYDLPLIILRSDFLAGTKYGVYASNMFSTKTELGTGIGVILKILPQFLFICFSALFKWRERKELKPLLLPILWFNYAYIVAVIFSMHIHIFNRLVDLMTFAPVITISYMMFFLTKSISYNKVLVFSVFFLLYFINFSLVIYKNASFISGGLGISPYQWIL